MDLGQPQPDAGRRSRRAVRVRGLRSPSKRGDRGVGVAAGERDLAGQKQRVGRSSSDGRGSGPRALERLAAPRRDRRPPARRPRARPRRAAPRAVGAPAAAAATRVGRYWRRSGRAWSARSARKAASSAGGRHAGDLLQHRRAALAAPVGDERGADRRRSRTAARETPPPAPPARRRGWRRRRCARCTNAFDRSASGGRSPALQARRRAGRRRAGVHSGRTRAVSDLRQPLGEPARHALARQLDGEHVRQLVGQHHPPVEGVVGRRLGGDDPPEADAGDADGRQARRCARRSGADRRRARR